MRKFWTKEETQFIIDNYKSMPREEIAARLGRTVPAVTAYAKKLAIPHKQRRVWTKDEDQYIRDNIGKVPVQHMLDKLNVSRTAFHVRLKKLGYRNWKAYAPQKKIDKNGYVVLWEAGGYRKFEHRVVAEEMLGRPLQKHEQVHHINFIRTDNRPENLYVTSGQAEHNRVHGKIANIATILIESGVVYFENGVYKINKDRLK